MNILGEYFFPPDKILLAGSLFYLGTKAKSALMITLALFVFFFNYLILHAFGIGFTSKSKEEATKRISISSSVVCLISILVAVFYTRILK